MSSTWTNCVVHVIPCGSRSPVGLYAEMAGPVDIAALRAALDESWSDEIPNDFEGDLDVEPRRP